MLKASEASLLGRHVSHLVSSGAMGEALAILSPVLDRRTPFRVLDRIGKAIGQGPIAQTRTFLLCAAGRDALGVWPIVGSALAEQVERDRAGTLQACRRFILHGGRWYTTDILAERVLGRALVTDLAATLDGLRAWRQDPDRWVRQALGVGVHNWAKQTHGAQAHASQAETLLGFLAPLFMEADLDAVKGIGWGLKTIGRFYPELLVGWLRMQLAAQGHPRRRSMLRKALTYLSEDQRSQVCELQVSS